MQWTPKEVSSWAREEMGQNIFKEEEEILQLLSHILSKRGVKYEESNLKRLLIWYRGNVFPADLLGVFQIETWEKVGTVLWKAISHSEKYILGLVTTWKLIISTVKQLNPEKTVTSISDSKLELWDDIGQKLWDKVSNGDKEAKSLVTTWKLIITTLKDLKAERSAAAGIFAALQPGSGSSAAHPCCSISCTGLHLPSSSLAVTASLLSFLHARFFFIQDHVGVTMCRG